MRMHTVQAAAYIPASNCSDPTSGAAGCSPDPLRFWVPEDFALRIASSANGSPSNPSGPIPVTSTTNVFIDLVRYVCGATTKVNKTAGGNSLGCADPRPHWAPLDPGSAVHLLDVASSVCIARVHRCVAIPYVDGVHYLGSNAPIVPSEFVEACGLGYPCQSERSATTPQATTAVICQPSPCPGFVQHPGGYDNSDVRQQCLFIDGYNKPTDKCQEEQAAVLFDIPNGSGVQKVSGEFVSQIGLADDTVNGVSSPRPGLGQMRDPEPSDGMGMTFWDDNHKSGQQKWTFINDYNGHYFLNSDAYYNMNDVPECAVPAQCPLPPFRSATRYEGGGQGLDGSPGIMTDVTTRPVQDTSANDASQGWGYATGIPYSTSGSYSCGTTDFPRSCPRTSLQYRDVCGSSFPLWNGSLGRPCAATDGSSGLFVGAYDYDPCSDPNQYCPTAGAQRFSRDGMERFYKYFLQADWQGTESAQAGTVLLSLGHKYEEYSVEWKWGWAIDLFPEAGPGFGFSLEPRDEQREDMTYVSWRYCFGMSSC